MLIIVAVIFTVCAFSALTLLIERQEEHPACKNWVVRCRCGYLSRTRYWLFEYGPADATASPSPASFKPRLALPFWCRLSQVVLEKRPLNECTSSSYFHCLLEWQIGYNSCVVVKFGIDKIEHWLVTDTDTDTDTGPWLVLRMHSIAR